ncbi:MAG TPA: Slp family lipoprotein [Patescibacteria group bacterium]|nr:Slp family lipoprotein [Patescibacteria group bacterium]
MAGRGLIAAALAALLAACAAPAPFLVEGARLDVSPQAAVNEDPGDVEVIWGGMIVGVRDHGDGSDIEVLAQPLDRRQRPLTQAPTQGRFVVRVAERLTRFDAPEGRYLTVRGRVVGAAEGRIGNAPYRFPILVDARWALWKQGFQFDDAQWSLGVGVAL